MPNTLEANQAVEQAISDPFVCPICGGGGAGTVSLAGSANVNRIAMLVDAHVSNNAKITADQAMTVKAGIQGWMRRAHPALERTLFGKSRAIRHSGSITYPKTSS